MPAVCRGRKGGRGVMTLPSIATLPGVLASYISAHIGGGLPRSILALCVVGAGFVAASLGAKLLASAFRIVLIGGGVLVAWKIFVR